MQIADALPLDDGGAGDVVAYGEPSDFGRYAKTMQRGEHLTLPLATVDHHIPRHIPHCRPVGTVGLVAVQARSQ